MKPNQYAVQKMYIFHVVLQPYKLMLVIAYITALEFLSNAMSPDFFKARDCKYAERELSLLLFTKEYHMPQSPHFFAENLHF